MIPLIPLLAALMAPALDNPATPLRAGLIGLDTSHVVAFTRILNDPEAAPDVAGCKVVAAYPEGSRDLEHYRRRVPGFRAELEKMGVVMVASIADLLERVDVVLLTTVDGRPHLEQALPVLAAHKPLFVDKPVAGSLADALRLYDAARRAGTPIFSSSALRYLPRAQAARRGEYGEIQGCDAFSPCSLEPHHPDLFWYGIHGVETLFTVMGPGCESVVRLTSAGTDFVAGRWRNGRIGTFRGIRAGKREYGGSAFGTKAIAALGPFEGYRPLVAQIVLFFRTAKAPVSAEETLEIYAFMEAADESKRRGGAAVSLSEVLERARRAAGIGD